jgi:hypothetical protein
MKARVVARRARVGKWSGEWANGGGIKNSCLKSKKFA